MKIATLNINGFTSMVRTEMLNRRDTDILFLQEVSHHIFDALLSYETYTNVGTSMRGTALEAREVISITNVTKLVSGCGIEAEYKGIRGLFK